MRNVGPEFETTIGNLIPGKGYQVFTNVDTVVPFTYTPIGPSFKVATMLR